MFAQLSRDVADAQSGSMMRRLRWLAVVALLALAGCEFEMRRPSVVYEFSESGVVESVDEIPDGIRVTFTHGDAIELGASTHDVDLYGELILEGELLLIGLHNSSIGYATLSIVLDACYILDEPAVDDGKKVLFRFGLRLPKAPDFDPGAIDNGQFPSFREGFCINSSGEVVRYGS